MFKPDQERKEETKQAVFGGIGPVHVRHYFTEPEIKAPCRLCAELIIPPGSSTGVHAHEHEDEIYLVQRGSGVMMDDGKEISVGPGDALITGNGATHAISNTGTEDLVITAVIIRYPGKVKT